MVIITKVLPYFLWVFIAISYSDSSCQAYQLGDAVDMVMRTSSGTEGVLRSQLPLFGKDSFAFFTGAPDHFSFSFEEGLRPVPWVKSFDDRERYLETLQVTFSYSKSGGGAISGLSSKPIYSRKPRADDRTGFSVQYKWMEEEKVHPRAGANVMLLSIFLASCLILLDSCCGDDSTESQKAIDRDEDTKYPVSYGDYNQVPANAPKWD
mmetsp:Transcript_16912/g.25030  ORF Transcript_16912/g.25030 Transcript_16912/m.25030 type:complete len:208 (-) Transcript_16912:180-803(-)|eukprot:CAMPEP_0194212224 /NCGR_PEP_ID=MMETSP0156-20130528/11930_1 /TAXON_ID=33649 /ORGANISM="Thalassionema nitzschioides, Strain L26-B" /LENGTH=207 /DNA_ID=CAMNT_0038939995 /DNA_START=88 /DNA_END=711 /DNA_ORIENTATION=+